MGSALALCQSLDTCVEFIRWWRTRWLARDKIFLFSFMCCNSTVVNRCSMFMPLPVLLLVGTFESQSINFKGVWLKGHHGGVVTAADCVFPLWHEVRCVLFSVGMIAFKVAGHLGNEKPAGCTVSRQAAQCPHSAHECLVFGHLGKGHAKSLIANNLQSTLDFLCTVNAVSFVREFCLCGANCAAWLSSV